MKHLKRRIMIYWLLRLRKSKMNQQKKTKQLMLNAQILNAIRANATQEYQERIPEFTDANIHKAYSEISRYTPMWNVFIEALINTVGIREFRNSQFENRLKPLKRGSLPFGGIIEDDAANLIKAEHYDPEDTNVFSQHKPEIIPQFYKVSRRDYYPLTINEELLSEAMVTEGALAPYVANLYRLPEQSAEWDEYLITKDITRQAIEDGCANIHVEDVLTASSQEEAGKALTQALKTWYEKAKFYRNDLNILGVDSTSKNMVLLTTPEIQASLQVNVLANAFHMNEAQFLADRVVMLDSFPVAGVQAMLVDEDFYRVYDEMVKTTSIYNPKTMAYTSYLHVWQVIAYSRAVNCICFSTAETNIGTSEPKTVTSVTASVVGNPGIPVAGEEYQLEAEVNYSDGSKDKRAYFLLSGGNVNEISADNVTEMNVILPDSGTYVDENMVLHISKDFEYKAIQITAVSTIDPTKNKTVKIGTF